MSLPLEQIRVLDFGQYVAGPAAAAMLADQGAEVIRIDPPGGPRWDSPAMAILNRRKKSVVLDLKQPDDLAIAHDLITTADVLIENFRPGVMAKLHIGPADAYALNPRLVYVALPGFASEDPEYAHLQAWEAIIAAAGGQFTDMGLNRILMGINPSFSPVTLASAYAALLASAAAVNALYAREEHGHGDYIEVPIAAALMEGLVYNSMVVEDTPERYKSLREREIDRRREAGEPFDMTYEELQEYLDPFYRSYECADGRPVYVVSACHVNHAHKTLEVLGLLDEAREAGLPELDDWYLPTSQWPEGMDCALGLYPLSKPWADWVAARMKQRFREKTSFEWEALCGKAGVPLAAHRTTQEWLNSEHPLKAGLVHEITDPEAGRKRQAGPVAWLASSADFVAQSEPPPVPDQHHDEILRKLATRDTTPHSDVSFTKDHCWLEGVKVLDMSNVIAGPMTGATLARFGADVIKLDPGKPTYDPWNTVLIGMQVHRGKRSILADVKHEQGREVFQRLIRWADVIVFNGVDRQLEPLGLDAASLKAVNPNVILCLLDCWGGPLWGPFSDYLGYDDLVQAATGIMTRFGGSMQTPEEHAHLGTIDVLTGFAAAFAVATALYKRKCTGQPDVARTSLSGTGQLLQIPFMYDFEGREPFNEPADREAKGCGPLYRCYEAADGWFFLAARPEAVDRLETLEELKGVGTLEGDEVEKFLVKRFRTRDAAYWVPRLVQADIGAIAMGSLAELREKYISRSEIDPHASGNTFQFVRYENHPSGRRVDLVAPAAIRPRYACLTVPAPAEKFGKDTRQILTQLGYSTQEIENLFAANVVSESWSEQYLPD